ALGAGDHVHAVDEHPAPLRLDQPDEGLQEDGLAGAGRAEHHAHLAGRQGQADVVPDVALAEGLGQPFDDHLDAHSATPTWECADNDYYWPVRYRGNT